MVGVEIEKALVQSAGNDTNTLLMICLLFVFIGLLGIFANFVFRILPEEMEKDRKVYADGLCKNTDAIKDLANQTGEQIKGILVEIKDLRETGNKNTERQLTIIENHDRQAKEIFMTDCRIETKLDNRPCAMKANL